jgi:hypothetical protein
MLSIAGGAISAGALSIAGISSFFSPPAHAASAIRAAAARTFFILLSLKLWSQ